MTADSSQMFDNEKMSGSEGCGELDWFKWKSDRYQSDGAGKEGERKTE